MPIHSSLCAHGLMKVDDMLEEDSIDQAELLQGTSFILHVFILSPCLIIRRISQWWQEQLLKSLKRKSETCLYRVHVYIAKIVCVGTLHKWLDSFYFQYCWPLLQCFLRQVVIHRSFILKLLISSQRSNHWWREVEVVKVEYWIYGFVSLNLFEFFVWNWITCYQKTNFFHKRFYIEDVK